MRWNGPHRLTVLRGDKQAPRAGEESDSRRKTANPSQSPPNPLSAGFQFLAGRPYSIAELRRALAKKFPQNEEAIDAAIARLRELGYLDDRKFAEQYASSLARNRAIGPHRLRHELKAKLVNYAEIDSAIEHAYEEIPARTLLENALDKKVRSLRLPLTGAKFQSLCRSLMRRGFNAGDIIKAVRARPELQPVAKGIEPLDLENTADGAEVENS
jgi:regulatory protein